MDLLRGWRERARLTQEELAERTGLSVRTVRRLETGLVDRPRHSSLLSLANALGLSPAERSLLLGQPPPQPENAREPHSPAQLPLAPAGFAGRETELDRLDTHDPQVAGSIVLIAGMGGVGKTALAVFWSQRVAHLFPDGQLFVDLRGFDATMSPLDPVGVLRRFLRALRVDAGEIPAEADEAAARFRTELARRRMLVVLDNAYSYPQVRPLLPGGSHCLVLVTSRRQLSGLLTHEGAALITLEPLSRHDAESLLRRALTTPTRHQEVDGIRELAAQCSYLPLALRVAAAHLVSHPRTTVAQYAAQVAAGPSSRSAGYSDIHAEVYATLALSYSAIMPEGRRLFRLAATHQGAEFSIPAAAAMVDGTWAATRRVIAQLCHAHLLIEYPDDRYGIHDIVRAFGRDCAHRDETEQSIAETGRRLTDFYAETVYRIDCRFGQRQTITTRDIRYPLRERMDFTAHAQALSWLGRERDNILAALAVANSSGWHELAWQLANDLFQYFNVSRQWPEWSSALRLGLASATRLGHLQGMAFMENTLGVVDKQTGDYRSAKTRYRRAIDLAIRAGDARLAAAFHINLGGLAINMGDPDEGIAHLRTALANEEISQAPYAGAVYVNLGCALIDKGRLAEATEALERAFQYCQAVEDRTNLCHSLHQLAEIALRRGDRETAKRHARQELSLAQEIGDPLQQARALDTLGSALADLQPDLARRYWHDAYALYVDLGHPAAEVLADWLVAVDAFHRRGEFEAADARRRMQMRWLY